MVMAWVERIATGRKKYQVWSIDFSAGQFVWWRVRVKTHTRTHARIFSHSAVIGAEASSSTFVLDSVLVLASIYNEPDSDYPTLLEKNKQKRQPTVRPLFEITPVSWSWNAGQ